MPQIPYRDSKDMEYYICKKCYKTSREKLTNCPKCGATNSFVPPDQVAPRSPMGPVSPFGADTGGVMPQTYEQYLPKLPILPSRSKKKSKGKCSKKE